ncbi:Ssn2p [Saccharomyces cerevisiae x Saccharomyces kudriavzevii VIN7]|uniref:Ssn2p n=1 Tax=Saccharomyces cerevisiae x Saccharomyces kudriavzevii (strain VIN7) TaxID=1095631 RepID=H0GTE3_SACCK|nr:Ssn2p [Saccharomyces cerevisiae x Saccharomyces kudriavzevii VIN7]
MLSESFISSRTFNDLSSPSLLPSSSSSSSSSSELERSAIETSKFSASSFCNGLNENFPPDLYLLSTLFSIIGLKFNGAKTLLRLSRGVSTGRGAPGSMYNGLVGKVISSIGISKYFLFPFNFFAVPLIVRILCSSDGGKNDMSLPRSVCVSLLLLLAHLPLLFSSSSDISNMSSVISSDMLLLDPFVEFDLLLSPNKSSSSSSPNNSLSTIASLLSLIKSSFCSCCSSRPPLLVIPSTLSVLLMGLFIFSNDFPLTSSSAFSGLFSKSLDTIVCFLSLNNSLSLMLLLGVFKKAGAN